MGALGCRRALALLFQGLCLGGASPFLRRGGDRRQASAAPWSCRIAGFEDFCRHWNACQTAPLASTIDRQSGRCLYGRAMPYSGRGDIADRGLAGPWRRTSMLQGGDAVALLAGTHCHAKGRGRALLRVGWTRPNLDSMYGYTVFSLPCAADVAPADAGYLPTVLSFGDWTPTSPPITATWEGVKSVVLITDNNTASTEVWDETSRLYSWSQGGLGFPGIANFGASFLQVCRTGSYKGDAGCCKEGTNIPSYQALQKAFANSGAEETSANRHYTDAATLRAYLENALALNPFYEGTGRTFDGCEGQYQISASSEYFFPNKHGGKWGNASDTVTVREVTDNGSGFHFVWGPEVSCGSSRSPCQYVDGTALPDCPLMNATITPALLPHIVGGRVDTPCALPKSSRTPGGSVTIRPVDGAPGGKRE